MKPSAPCLTPIWKDGFGWALQEDFGERLLPSILNQFARTHPKVRIEGRIARNKELREKVANGQLDLALAWNDGALEPQCRKARRYSASLAGQ